MAFINSLMMNFNSFSIYILGAYLSVILAGLLLESSSFRIFADGFANILKERYKGLQTYHNYSIIITLVYFISLFSWLGIVLLIALIIDYCIWKSKN